MDTPKPRWAVEIEERASITRRILLYVNADTEEEAKEEAESRIEDGMVLEDLRSNKINDDEPDDYEENEEYDSIEVAYARKLPEVPDPNQLALFETAVAADTAQHEEEHEQHGLSL